MINTIIRFSIKNPVLVNVIMLGIVIMGAVSLTHLPPEAMPKIDMNWVFIVVTYPGVNAEEIEKLIAVPIEEEIEDVEHIESVSSVSSEGKCVLSVKFKMLDEDKFDRVYQDLRVEVDKVNLPEDADDPYVFDFSTYDFMPMINILMSGDLPEKQMNDYAEDLRDEIEGMKGISEVSIFGMREREIWVQVDPVKMQGYNLSFNDVVNVIMSRNLNVPGGTIDIGRKVYSVRTVGEFDKVEDIGKLVVRSNLMDSYVRIDDFAAVADTFEERLTTTRANGKQAIMLSVTKEPSGSTLELTDNIKALAKQWDERHQDMKILTTWDTSVYIRDILSKLRSNAILGLILVGITLFVLLGWRSATFAAIGIPVSFALCFIFMWQYGSSFNGTSLFGLVLVLGMLVDDAIVVVENAYRYIEAGIAPAKAALIGANEVAAPVISSVLTTIAAFLPLMLLPGIIGEFMKIVPVVVSFALAASLFESFVILPSHIADWSRPIKNKVKRKEWKPLRIIRRLHLKYLKTAIRRRYIVIAVIVILVPVSSFVVPLVGTDLFSDDEVSQFNIFMRMPAGTSLEATDNVVREIEKRALLLPAEELETVVGNAGLMQTETEWINASNVGQVIIDIVERRDRTRDTREIIQEMEEKCKDIPGIEYINFATVSTGPPVGKPVEVKVKGEFIDQLLEVSELVKQELRAMDGVYNVDDDFSFANTELTINVDEEKAALLGLNVAYVATNVRAAFEGITAGVYREGDDEIDIRVLFTEPGRDELADVGGLKIALPSGGSIPLSDVAGITSKRTYRDIRRFNEERAVTVSAEVEEGVTTPIEVNRELQASYYDKIGILYPGYKLDFEGEFKEFEEAFNNIGELFAFGLIIVYSILCAQFKSWLQPLIIMFTIPFAFMGAMFGLLVNQFPFSITTMYGIVALAGIVVNDSTVMIDFMNKRRMKGASRVTAILRSGKVRLRPILLTSITTIGGLLPMALGIGGKSAVWQPLANVIVWGLAVSTLLTLFVIPAIYAIAEDLRKL
ncbi:MAG: hypothetical protein GF307_03125, partial [candidate division Zixibacteria bacterium]|nr:hypothetical protein [candidate division Zixibacteria bacterium]